MKSEFTEEQFEKVTNIALLDENDIVIKLFKAHDDEVSNSAIIMANLNEDESINMMVNASDYMSMRVAESILHHISETTGQDMLTLCLCLASGGIMSESERPQFEVPEDEFDEDIDWDEVFGGNN